MVSICPRCQTRYMVAAHSGDYVHQCTNNSAAVTQEDVVKNNGFVDYTGSGGTPKGELRYAGTDNTLQGTDAGVRGEQFNGVTDRGKTADTHRQRQHLEYIENPGNTER